MTDTQEPTLAPSGDVEPLPCPHCASLLCAKVERRPRVGVFVVCPSCCAQGPACSTPTEAIVAWNRRAAPQSPAPLAGQEFDAGELARELERVARAIFDADVHRCGDWGARSDMVRDDYRNLARAAIAALHPQSTAPLAGQKIAGELAGELERLDREATPGPWRVGTWGNGEHVPGLEHIFLDTIESTIQDVLAEDAALIVALRNNLPTILAALRSTQQPDLLPLLREARDVLRQTDIESAHLTLSGETREQIRRALAHLDATLAQEGDGRG